MTTDLYAERERIVQRYASPERQEQCRMELANLALAYQDKGREDYKAIRAELDKPNGEGVK